LAIARENPEMFGGLDRGAAARLFGAMAARIEAKLLG
jgi:hypothetical protein